MMRSTAIAMFVVGLLCAGAGTTAAPSWMEVHSPHFVVLSDAGEKTARNVGWQFEQIRTALQQGWPWLGETLDRPITVIGARDERSMRALVPGYWEKGSGLHPVSVFVTAPDRHYLLVQTDVRTDGPEGINPYREAYWSYGAVALESSANRGLPLWFVSGFREVISNTNVNNDLVQFGRPLRNHLSRVQERLPYSFDQLFQFTRDSREYRQEDRRWDYDAECWGLMQYLLFGGVEVTNRDATVNHLADELLKGRSASEVVTEVFGSVGKLEYAVRQFIHDGVFRYASVKVDAAIDARSFAAAPVQPGSEWVMRAAVHAAMGRAADARAAIAEAEKADPTLAAPFDVEGQLLEQDKDAERARLAYEKAVAGGSTNFYTHYRLASLMWAPAATPDFEKIDEIAARAASLNDAYVPALSLLANVRLRLRKFGGAVAPATRAIQLRPNEPAHRLVLAEALNALGDKASAIKLAQVALQLSRTDDERRRAQDALDRYSREERD
jgi:tetratricopeptide (TPR) repeat protein